MPAAIDLNKQYHFEIDEFFGGLFAALKICGLNELALNNKQYQRSFQKAWQQSREIRNGFPRIQMPLLFADKKTGDFPELESAIWNLQHLGLVRVSHDQNIKIECVKLAESLARAQKYLVALPVEKREFIMAFAKEYLKP